MRYALISDIHGNLTALKAVLADLINRGPIDRVWCLGDIVGYGPDPNECVDLLRSLDLRCVLGNHDAAGVGKANLAEFNPAARAAALWTMGQLTEDSRQFLSVLPLQVAEGEHTLVHGSPRDPVWEYITTPSQARLSFDYLQTPHCFVGHTHIPALYVYFPENNICTISLTPAGRPVDIAVLKGRTLANPGSVGQPRDGDPRASYALLDGETSTYCHFRVPYDIEQVQRRMRKLDLPPMLIERLSYGW